MNITNPIYRESCFSRIHIIGKFIKTHHIIKNDLREDSNCPYTLTLQMMHTSVYIFKTLLYKGKIITRRHITFYYTKKNMISEGLISFRRGL